MNMWDDNTIRRVRFDYPLLITVVLLTGLGLTMIFSTSALLAQEKFNDSLYFLKRSLLYTGIGFAGMALLIRFPYLYWRRLVYPLLVFSLALGILTLFTPVGLSVGGARRWLHLGWITFQFSELVKLAVILFMAYSMERKLAKMETFTIGILPHLVLTGLLILLVLWSKDLGAALVISLLVYGMLFLGGARFKHLLLLSVATLPFLFYLIQTEGYRIRRVLTFLNPWEDRLGSGFQIIQSFLAFNEGGFIGKGLGAGQQKLFYLPEAHTDFIFSVLGEELGFIGVSLTVVAFLVICFRGIRIGQKAPDLFGRYLAFGVVMLIGAQSLFNMGVVLGLLPTKGMVLPLIGYGGSNLVMTLLAVGILLNVSTYQRAEGVPSFVRRGMGEVDAYPTLTLPLQRGGSG